jgi:hypothetical protein
MKKSPRLTIASLALCLAASAWLVPYTAAQDVKTTDTRATGAAFSVSDEAAAPVYDAKIRVHIAYGFMYLHKMDLEIGTNVDGKARFTGLPARTKVGLNFQASKADREGTAFVDPATTCNTVLTIVLHDKIN